MTSAAPVASLLMQAALGYARAGFDVFPCEPERKRPLLPKDIDPETGKPIKGSGGLNKATRDEALIVEWWTRWPNALIGLPTGQDRIFVLDFDPRVDPVTGEVFELEGLKAELEAQMGCALPRSRTAMTQSDGVHVWLRWPDDGGLPITNRGNLPDHVDVRGKGGYVIVPPSIMHSGARYRWLRGGEEPIVDAPAALIDILRSGAPAKARSERAVRQAPPAAIAPMTDDELLNARIRKYALTALDEECRELAGTPIGGGRWGGRNRGIYHTALKMGSLVAAGALSEGVARAAIEDVVRAMPANADLPGALQTLENGLTDGMAKPRDLSELVNAVRGRSRSGGAMPLRAPLPDAPPEGPWNGQPGPRTPDGEEDGEGFHSGMAGRDHPAGGRGGRVTIERNVELDRRCGLFNMTDLGNAERFRARFGHVFRFCKELGWFLWDGRRWALLSEEKDKVPGEVAFAVFQTVRAIRNEADAIEASGMKEDVPADATDEQRAAALDFIVKWVGPKDDQRPVTFSDVLRQHAQSSEGASRLGCIGNLAKAFADIAIDAAALDSDRLAINVLNGTLRLVKCDGKWTIRRDDHDPADLITKIANVIFDPTATCARYDAFLEQVQPDPAMRRFLNQWGGYSGTGDISEHKLAFFYGGGRNGKSTLVDTWAYLWGDYSGSIGFETFLDQGRGRKGGDATPDLARLPGVRFLRTSEPEKGAKLAEALIKAVTGGEEIQARLLNKGFFDFLPSFKLTASGNHRPKVTDFSHGFWARLMLVPWEVQIEEKDIDRQLPEKLKEEASGILNRLIEGLLDWRENGLILPDAVSAATAKYRDASDQLGRFLAECTKPEKGARSKSSALHALFNAWAKATGVAEWQPHGFSKAMEDRGFEKKASNGMQWLDIEMTKTVADFSDRDARDDGGGGYSRDPFEEDDDGPL